MTYKTHPMPRVVPVRTDGRGVTWVLCEDCTRLLPATRRHGEAPRVIPHLRHPRAVGRSRADWPAHRRTARRLVWRCQGGGRLGIVDAAPAVVGDVCAGCAVAVVARELVAA